MRTKILLAFCAAFAMSTTAVAQSNDPVAAFYKQNNTIRLLVSSEAGGGYDAYSRLLARHMGKFIPGNPTFIVQNMPGGGGLVGANHVYNVAPKDGPGIGNVQRLVPFIQIMGEPGPKFETGKFNWLGSLASEATVCVSWHTTKVKTFEDLKKIELIVGGSGPNDSETVPALLNNILGTKFKIVSGYPSSTAATLAVERTEVDGICSSYSSLITRNGYWFKDKKINVLVQASLRKHPDLPNVPLALELATNAEDKALMELNDARLEIGRPFMAPPGVPAERVKALRAAFNAMVKDKDFLADAEKLKMEIDPVGGDEAQALLERVAQAPQTLIARLADAQRYKGPTVTAKVESAKAEGSIAEVQADGSKIVLKLKDGKMFKTSVSGSRTNLQVTGKKADRKELKVGLACSVTAPGDDQEASAIDCK